MTRQSRIFVTPPNPEQEISAAVIVLSTADTVHPYAVVVRVNTGWLKAEAQEALAKNGLTARMPDQHNVQIEFHGIKPWTVDQKPISEECAFLSTPTTKHPCYVAAGSEPMKLEIWTKLIEKGSAGVFEWITQYLDELIRQQATAAEPATQ